MPEPTADPAVVIEARGDGWVRYQSADGRRWEVHGQCDRRGDCLIGAVVDGRTLTRQDVDRMRLTGERPDSLLDVPVTPEFAECCAAAGLLIFVSL